MKAKVYIGAIKYAVYIGRKIVEKTMNFFGFPARFFSIKDGVLKDYKMYGNTVQSNLPEGYTQLESISSTGYEYINTGLVMQSGDEIQLDYEWLGDTPASLSADMMFLGCQNLDPTIGGVWVELYRRSDGTRTWYARLGGTSSASAGATTEQITGRHLLSLNQTRLALDGTTLVGMSVGDTFQTTPLTLFGRFNQTGTLLNSSRIKVYGLKVINNGVVRLNLIPCKNADNILGMYDTVTEQFLVNSGTGEFIAGAAVQPTPTTPVEIESVGVYDSATGKYKIPVNVNGTITNIYLDEPLRKLGDYTDYIDFDNQKVVRNVYCQTDITQGASLSAGRYLCNTDKENISQSQQVTIALSNILQDGSNIAYEQFSYLYNYVGMYRNSLNVPRIVISKIDGASTIQDFQNALKGIEIYYPLRTPTEESITLPAIALQKGNITMDTETKIKPSQLTITGDIDDVR